MLFRQFVDEDLGCASYLLGDERAGVAVVVDPAYDVDPYLGEAERRGVRLTHVLETHTHADHVSGHGRLSLELGLPVHVHPAAEVEFEHEPLAEGDELDVGDVAIRVVHTPGHRPEHCCFLVADRSRGEEPWLVLTGDSLLVGDAARPDLAVDPRHGAHDLFRSVRRLLELGDWLELYPGHVAGSLCGAAMSSKPSSTIGFERLHNPAAGQGEGEFVAALTASAGARPANLERIVALNRGPFVGAAPPLERCEVPEDGVVLDVRHVLAFAAGHVRGAINVPLDASGFGTKAGGVLDPDDSIALFASTRAEAELGGKRLRAVGFLELGGWIEEAVTDERMTPVDLEELARLIEGSSVEVVDVRDAEERDGGYIPGSRHVPYRLLRAYARELADGRPIVTICETGSRAGIAASVLVAAGADARPVLEGGMAAWRARGGEAVEFRRCGT